MNNPPNIYHLDPATGALTGMGYADPDPKDPGNWLIPAQATTETPPSVPAGHIAVHAADGWAVREDHRGEVYWLDGEQIIMTTFGAPPEGATEEGPPDAEVGHVVQWIEGGWVQVPDHRGEVWWLGENQPVVVDELGDPADQGLLAENPYVAPPPPNTISKNTIFERMTDAEAELVETMLAGAPTKLRLLFNGTSELNRDSEYFPTLVAAMEGAYGADRTADLLA